MSTTTTTAPTLDDCEVASLCSNGNHRLCLRFRDGLVAELNFTGCVAEDHGPQARPCATLITSLRCGSMMAC